MFFGGVLSSQLSLTQLMRHATEQELRART